MANRYSSDDYRDVQPGIRRSAAPSQNRTNGASARGGVQPGIRRSPASTPYRSGSGTSSRPAASRTGARPASAGTRAPAQRSANPGTRSQAQRPAYASSRSGAPRTSPSRGQQGRAYSASGSRNRRSAPPPRRGFGALAAIAGVVLALIVIAVIFKPFGLFGGRNSDKAKTSVNAALTSETGTTVTEGGTSEVTLPEDSQPASGEELTKALADSDADVGSLSQTDMAKVSDLSMNTSLPTEWMNILLLGTDERELNDSARTDSMMICSINVSSGEVKLASIQRDLAIDYSDLADISKITKSKGPFRINAANFFGGPNLAMKTVNKRFGMNIQYYVMVNFTGFQRIAQQLGGVDIDITKEEMDQINEWAYDAYIIAKHHHIDISDLEYKKLTEYGENTHLNGTQALAYARIRKLDGGDYARSERQRKVLAKLAQKVRGMDLMSLTGLAGGLYDQVKTNLPLNDIISTAFTVMGSSDANIEQLRLPVAGTYTEERRNDDAMLWDCDFNANAIQLYNFIYE